MTLVASADLLAAAVADGTAVPAFNVVMLEQAEAVVRGAADAGAPIILQVSQNAIRFHSGYAPLLAACRELAVAAAAPAAIHADHVEDEDLALALIADAARLGLGSLMFDASRLDFDDNCAATARIVHAAHAAGLAVEAELGEIGGKRGAHTPGVRTDPGEAAAFVERTSVDALAVAVGSEHAMTSRTAVLDETLIRALADAVPVPLVLHGSSGVPDAALRRAVEAGIRKVNIGTALGTAWTTSLRDALGDHPEAHDPRDYTAGPRTAVQELVSGLCALISRSPQAPEGVPPATIT